MRYKGTALYQNIMCSVICFIFQEKSREVLISYLMYIKEQTDKKPSLCNIDELKDLAQVVTSDGLKNPSREPVHFTCHYGNKINLPATFPGTFSDLPYFT